MELLKSSLEKERLTLRLKTIASYEWIRFLHEMLPRQLGFVQHLQIQRKEQPLRGVGRTEKSVSGFTCASLLLGFMRETMKQNRDHEAESRKAIRFMVNLKP